MKNGMLIALGIGAALLLLGGKNAGGNDYTPTCRRVKLPDGSIVCEDVLPSLGYIQYRDGNWYHRSQFKPPAGSTYSGINVNTQQWQGILTNLISQGANLFQQFQYTQGGEPETWAGDSGAGGDAGGNDPYSGIGIITIDPSGMTRFVCKDGRYSNAKGKGACTKHGGTLYKYK